MFDCLTDPQKHPAGVVSLWLVKATLQFVHVHAYYILIVVAWNNEGWGAGDISVSMRA